jgi:3-oxoacyl-[acyl-carrier-protein] synthase III
MQEKRRVKIAGIGKCLPSRVVTSAELEERLGLERGWIERKTGIVERRYVRDETVSSMGAEAARAALSDAGRSLAGTDLLICASACTEQKIPCTAVFIQRALGPEAEGVPCFDVNSTCLSFLHGLEIAANAVAMGSARQVLVVSSEVSSAALDWSQKESCVLLGDGAAAIVVTRAEEGEPSALYRAAFTTHSSGAELAQLRGGGIRHHPNDPRTTPEMNLFQMCGPQIFRFTQRLSVPFIRQYVDGLPFPSSELAAVVAHQASLFALRATTRACGFEPEQVLENIQTHGNCVAASIPMLLHDSVRARRIRRGDPILLAGTAAGISVGALAMVF